MSVLERAANVASSEARARTEMKLALSFSIAFCIMAFLYAVAVPSSEGLDRGNISAYSVTFLLFYAQDQVVAAVFVILFLISIALLNWDSFKSRVPAFTVFAHKSVPALCVGAFLLAWAAAAWVHHSFDMSVDEFVTAFQARIFLEGELWAQLSPAQFDYSQQLQPLYLYFDEAHRLWASGYRPVFSAFRALFMAFGADRLLNPAFAALSVWAISDIARRAFPETPEAPALSAVLLLLSPQFLLTAASGFAFSAHLALNLLWLALFLRGSLRAHWLAALVGFLATGLHQVVFHPLFAAPFLVALLFGGFGSRKALIPYAVAYSLALPLWIAWYEVSLWLQTGDTAAFPSRFADLAYFRDYVGYIAARTDVITNRAGALTFLNVFRYGLWLSPVLLPLSIIAFVRCRTLGLVPILCGISVALTVAATYFLLPNQMQTWGSRYFHPVLGCSVIFAVAGYVAIKSEMGLKSLRAEMAFLLLVSALILLPWRATQVEEKVGPRARVQQAIESLDADYVVIGDHVWFGNDYIRNDPYLRNRPLIANSELLNKPTVFAGKKVVVLDQTALNRLGLPRGTVLEPGR
jgi:hypothetical protein